MTFFFEQWQPHKGEKGQFIKKDDRVIFIGGPGGGGGEAGGGGIDASGRPTEEHMAAEEAWFSQENAKLQEKLTPLNKKREQLVNKDSRLREQWQQETEHKRKPALIEVVVPKKAEHEGH